MLTREQVLGPEGLWQSGLQARVVLICLQQADREDRCLRVPKARVEPYSNDSEGQRFLRYGYALEGG